MNLTESAKTLGVSPRTLRLVVERGEIEAEHPLDGGPWIFNRQAMKTEAAAQFPCTRPRQQSQLPQYRVADG